jgi:hypothetical protein
MSAQSLELKWRSIHHIGELEQLKDLADLRELDLQGNYITFIGGLAHLTKLKILNLSGNGISEINGLENLTQLKVLKIGSPQQYYEPPGMYGHADAWDREYFKPIAKIKGLENLVKLEVLDLRRNKIKRIEGLKTLINLKTLDLSGNPITKIENREIPQQLEKLYVHGCKLSTVSGLKHLGNLEELSMTYNPIQAIDYQIAKHMVNLKRCDLPIHKILKTEKINDFVSLKFIDQDYSRYGRFSQDHWDFYPKFTTMQMSCLLAIIYVKDKMFRRECPPGPQRKKVKWGGLKVENEKEFDSYCRDLKKWIESGYEDGIFPKYMTKPLRKMIDKAQKP